MNNVDIKFKNNWFNFMGYNPHAGQHKLHFPEKATSDNESLLEKADKHDAYVSSRRDMLLEKHPVEDQEKLKELPLDTLEFVTEKINKSKPNVPEIPGNARKKVEMKPYSEMTAQEKKDNWKTIVEQYKPGN